MQDIPKKFLGKLIPSYPTIARARAILTPRDRRRLGLMTAFQIFIGLFDIYGILMIGAIGALAIQIIEGKPAGNRVKFILKLFHLQNFSLSTDVAILGLIACSVLIGKSLISVFIQRKIFRFLSFRSSVLTSNLLKKVLSQDLIEIQKTPSQQTLATVTGSVRDLLLGLLGTYASLIADLSLLVLIIVSLVAYDVITALFLAFLFGSLVITLTKLMSKRAKVIGQEIVNRSIKNDSKILEVLQSYRESVVRNRRGFYANEVAIAQGELSK